jgi:quercetin dioxygenase-like cupin family protein
MKFLGRIGRHGIFAVGAAVAFTVALTAAGVLYAQQAAQSQRYPLFENDEMKVWRSVVIPNAPLAMHRHEHGRIVYVIKGGTMKIVESTGQTESHAWEAGKVYWLGVSAPGTMHSDVNGGDKPIEVLVVELKKDR